MESMSRQAPTDELGPQVERALQRCLEWSQLGRHRRVLTEVEKLLPRARRQPRLEARLLIWKAQALLAMGCLDRALAAAERSWDLESSPHACHLMSNAQYGLGETDRCEDLLRAGCEVFPDAVHLPIQLAMVLADIGRVPEAIEVLEGLPGGAPLPEDLDAFVLGFRANLLATVGQWSEADELLRDGLDRDPESSLLRSAHDQLEQAWCRARSQRRLVRSWRDALLPLAGVAAEVDGDIEQVGAVLELPPLVVLAARRLWRAAHEAESPRLQAPRPWAAAAVLCVLELDGERPSAAALARATRTRPATVRSAARRLRAFLGRMDPELARRAFAAAANPRLDEEADPGSEPAGGRNVVRFPGS